MSDNPSRELDDRIDGFRAEDEPADSWRPVAPAYGPGLGMEVVPTDLEHFSQMAGADREAFQQSLEDADNQRGPWFPNFSGFQMSDVSETLAETPSDAMPEGMAFQRTYLDSYVSLLSLLGEAAGGLVMLEGAALGIHAEYLKSDILGSSGRNPFSTESGYDPRLVQSAFNADTEAIEQVEENRASLQAESDWGAALDQARGTDGAGGEGAGDTILIGDSDLRPTGLNTPAPDSDSVVWTDGSEDYRARASEDATEPGDISISRPSPVERRET
jgi:hypothetical protein